jgi:hypothetical protein
VNHANLLHI